MMEEPAYMKRLAEAGEAIERQRKAEELRRLIALYGGPAKAVRAPA